MDEKPNSVQSPERTASPVEAWSKKWMPELLKTLLPAALISFAMLAYLVPKLLEQAQAKAVEATVSAKVAKDQADALVKELAALTTRRNEQAASLADLEEKFTQLKSAYEPFADQLNSILKDPAKQGRALEILKELAARMSNPDPAGDVLLAARAFSDRFSTGNAVIGGPVTVLGDQNPVLGGLWWVRIEGDQYDYRFLLIAGHNETRSSGHVEVIKVLRDLDNADAAKRPKYGSPTFMVDDKGRLVVHGRTYPAGKLKVRWSRFNPD